VIAAQSVAATGTEILGNQPSDGPVSIEGFYDEVFAVPAMIEQIRLHNDCDGHVVACFDDRYGENHRCVSIRASDIPVLDLEKQDSGALAQIAAECEQAIQTDGAEAIVLGCAGMTDLAQQLSNQFGLPVIDGVTAAVKHIEGLVSMQLTTSRINGYKNPVEKDFIGDFSRYAVKAEGDN